MSSKAVYLTHCLLKHYKVIYIFQANNPLLILKIFRWAFEHFIAKWLLSKHPRKNNDLFYISISQQSSDPLPALHAILCYRSLAEDKMKEKLLCITNPNSALIFSGFCSSDVWKVLQSQSQHKSNITMKYSDENAGALNLMCQGSRNLCLIYLKGSFSSVEDLSLGHKKELIQLSRSALIVICFILQESRRKSG